MAELRGIIESLIAETEVWRQQHKAANRQIEAAACSIRKRAFVDLLRSLEAQ